MIRPKVSITVPVYNVERYLSQCLDSIVNQTLKDIEIILVDDGSTDDSASICDAYAANDKRIKVIHKSNGGLASARQAGLECVSGEYYTVCDSDDWIELDFCETLYNKAKECNADIVLSSYFSNYSDGRVIPSKSYEFVSQEQYIYDTMTRKTAPMTWSKLIRTDLFKRFNIGYEIGINLGEDALLLYKFLKHPLRIVSVDKPFYHYRREMLGDSYTNNISLKTLAQLEYVDKWKRENYSEARYDKIHIISVINLCCTALRTKDMNRKKFKEILSQVSISQILSHRIITFKSMCVIFAKIFGFRVTRYMFKKLYCLYYK